MQDLDDPSLSGPSALNVARYGTALLEKSRLLLITCACETTLEQQAHELMLWLRQGRRDLSLEPVTALEGDFIIQRFNEMLAQLSIEAAVRPDTPAGTQRIWLLRDNGQLGEHEVRLLVKLQQQFPAAGLSSIVITHRPERFAALMTSDERGLLSWSLPAPTGWQAPAPTAPAEAAPRAAANAPAPTPKAPARAPVAARTSAGRTRKILTGALMGFVTSTTLIVAGLLWLHSQGQLGQLKAWMGLAAATARSETAAVNEASPAPTSPAPAADAPAPAEAAPASATPAQASAEPDKEPAAAASSELKQVQAPATAAASSPAGVAASASATSAAPPIKAPEPTPKPAEDKTTDGRAPAQADPRVPPPVPPVLKEGQRWAAKLGADAYLVSHGRFDSIAQAEQFAKKHAYLQNARMLPASPQDAGKVLLVTGPFQSEPRARGYVARLELKDASVLKASDAAR